MPNEGKSGSPFPFQHSPFFLLFFAPERNAQAGRKEQIVFDRAENRLTVETVGEGDVPAEPVVDGSHERRVEQRAKFSGVS